ncbi:MAG: hypothetical protein WBB17_05195 [Saprospiraceae bacterium]
MKLNLFLFLFFAFLNVNIAQLQHSIYLAPGVNLYQYAPRSLSIKSHRFINNWQSSLGYRLLYRVNRFAIYGTAEVKYSKIKFKQSEPTEFYSGVLVNAEATIGLSYRIYKKLAIGLDHKQIHELNSSGRFFKSFFELDDDYFGFTLSLQYQFSKHFETGLHLYAPAGNQFSKYSDIDNFNYTFVHAIYLNNLDLRFYYNF